MSAMEKATGIGSPSSDFQGIGKCPVCDGAFDPGGHDWVWRCSSCGFLKATLDVRTVDECARRAIDEDKRSAGLQALRQANFERVLDHLAAVSGVGAGRLLDVGCAHGWFLEAARRRGYTVFGIEPDPAIRAQARERGLTVWQGHFPEDIPPGETFDVIAFNDVFEHLPCPNAVLAACRRLLAPNGLLVINLPSSTGLFYRLAGLLDRCGVSGPFERMWQKNFASPHLIYLTPAHLRNLAARHGLVPRRVGCLPAVEAGGLWARLRYDRQGSFAAAAVVWLAVRLALPVLALLPADIVLGIYGAAGEAGRERAP